MLLAALLLVSTDNPELEALRKVDQSDRHFVSSPQEIDWEKISIRDAARQQRVREILLADLVRTARDFDNAALIMQHGSKPNDYLLAHELAAIATYFGNYGSLTALAQDRWLDSIGRKQRWGSQFDWDGNVKPMETTGASVTDQMRRDMLLPTAAEIEEHGMRAPMLDVDKRIEYIQKRLELREKPVQMELKNASVVKALEFVQREKLVSANDYAEAAMALSNSKKTDELLLAHELSVVAMAWRADGAPKLFASTLDRYLVSIGLPKRYAGGNVAAGVARILKPN